jgi:hypothetical protein
MAGENTVSIQFIAETAQMSAAFAKIETELAALSTRKLSILDAGQTAAAILPLARVKTGIEEIGLAAQRVPRIFDQGVEIDEFGQAVKNVKSPLAEATSGVSNAAVSMAAWRKETGLSEQATIDVNRTMVTLGGTVGKTAADFSPATAEMRAASVAEEEVANSAQRAGGGLSAFRGNMRALRIDLFVVVAALAALKAAFDSYAESEAASRHLAAQGMGGAAGGLEKAAKAQFFDPKEFDQAAISLKVAGAIYGDVTSEVSELGKASRISGVPFKELYETFGSLSEELQMGGVPSLSEMNTLTLASSGNTQGLTDRYKELAGALKLTEQGWKVDSEQRQRNYQISERQASTVTSLSSKMGFGEAAMMQAGIGSIESYTRKRSPGDYLGFGSSGSMGGEISKQMSEGMAQLTKETGLGSEELKMFFFYGKLGYSDLTSASQRYQSQKKEESEFQIKQSQEQLRLDTEKEQRALGLAALQEVMTPSAYKDAEAALQKASPEAISQKLTAEMTAAMQGLGKMIAEHFPLVVVAIKALGAAILLSKVAGANARFFGGAPAAAGEAGAAEDAVAGATKAGGSLTAGVLSFVGSALTFGEVIQSLDDATGGNHPRRNLWNEQEFAKAPKSMAQIMGQGKPADGSVPDSSQTVRDQTPSWSIPPGGVKPASQPASGKGTVEDPTTHDLLQQLLKVFQGA